MFFDKVAARQQFKFFNTYRKSIMYNSQAAVTTTQFQSHYSTQSNTFDAQHFQQHLTTSAVGRYFMYRQVVDSTMNLAQQECSNGAPTGTLILAEEQTQGKGRMNREWSSAGKGNLYFTIIFRTKEFVDLCKLNLSIAMAVARACREEGVLDAGVKWPNDVWIKGKKVSGMLIDSSTTMGNNNSMFQACCGVGINVNENMQQNDKVAHLATSLHDTLGHSVCREILLARICNHLETLLSRMDIYILLTFARIHARSDQTI